MIRSDDDDGIMGQSIFLDRCENPAHAGVKLAGAAVVKRADLLHFLGRQGFPFGFQIGAADERIDVEINRGLIGAPIFRIAKHATIRLLGPIGKVVARVENVPKKRLPLVGGIGQSVLDPLRHHFRCHKFRERTELGENLISQCVIEVEGYLEMGHHHRLAHVNLEAVEAGNGNIVEPERHQLVIARTPIADGGSGVAFFLQHFGQRNGVSFGFFDRFPVRIHLPQSV